MTITFMKFDHLITSKLQENKHFKIKMVLHPPSMPFQLRETEMRSNQQRLLKTVYLKHEKKSFADCRKYERHIFLFFSQLKMEGLNKDMHSFSKDYRFWLSSLFKLKYELKRISLTLEPPNKKGCQCQQKSKKTNKEHLFPGQVEVI